MESISKISSLDGSNMEENEDIDIEADTNCFVTSRSSSNKSFFRYENREKARQIYRLRKIIKEMNERCDEQFMLTIAAPDVSKHMSYYGSRSLIRSAFNAGLKSCVEQEQMDKTVLYVPQIDTTPSPDEPMMSDQQLNVVVAHLMDSLNYPVREHYSAKKMNRHPNIGRLAKPKPEYWPEDVRFVSVISTEISRLMESSSPALVLHKREAFMKVITRLREYYATQIENLMAPNQDVERVFLRRPQRKRKINEKPEDFGMKHDESGEIEEREPVASGSPHAERLPSTSTITLDNKLNNNDVQEETILESDEADPEATSSSSAQIPNSKTKTVLKRTRFLYKYCDRDGVMKYTWGPTTTERKTVKEPVKAKLRLPQPLPSYAEYEIKNPKEEYEAHPVLEDIDVGLHEEVAAASHQVVIEDPQEQQISYPSTSFSTSRTAVAPSEGPEASNCVMYERQTYPHAHRRTAYFVPNKSYAHKVALDAHGRLKEEI